MQWLTMLRLFCLTKDPFPTVTAHLPALLPQTVPVLGALRLVPWLSSEWMGTGSPAPRAPDLWATAYRTTHWESRSAV